MNPYETLSGELNLPLVGQGSALPKIPLVNIAPEHQYLEGEFQGRHTIVHDFHRTYTGQNSVAYHSIQLWLKRDTECMLAIMPKGLLLKLAVLGGMQDVPTGDEAFDKAFVVKSNDKGCVTSILNPNLRQRLLKNVSQWPWHHGRISLNYDLRDEERQHVLRFEEQGCLSSDKDVQRVVDLMPLLIELAEGIENLKQF